MTPSGRPDGNGQEGIWLLLSIVVVAIIFFGIGVPGLTVTVCNCGGRSIVSRAKSDMRNMATGIESYMVDHGEYVAVQPLPDFLHRERHRSRLRAAGGEALTAVRPGSASGIGGLTTPIAYLATIPFDSCLKDIRGIDVPYAYYRTPDSKGWILWSTGPDGDYDITSPALVYDPAIAQPSLELLTGGWTYDPTNGTESSGDIYRVRE